MVNASSTTASMTSTRTNKPPALHRLAARAIRVVELLAKLRSRE
jgi:hypothetical protein